MSRRALLETYLKSKLTVQDNNKKSPGSTKTFINYTKLCKKVIYYHFFVISTGASCHGASCPQGELSVGRVVMGRAVHGASCPWSELSMGRVVHGPVFYGASCLWGKLSWGEFSWGELSVGRVSMGRVVQEPPNTPPVSENARQLCKLCKIRQLLYKEKYSAVAFWRPAHLLVVTVYT